MDSVGAVTGQVRKMILDYSMIRTGDLVAVGLSGGQDSVCLLSVLRALSEEMGFTLAALHVHHGIRGSEADGDALFCLTLCGSWGIPCEVAYVDVPTAAASGKQSLEEAARTERYRCLSEYGNRLGARRIAVAHHQEDNAETVLWNLFRGSGLKGLGGMEPVNGCLIRPLLNTPREAILEYLQREGLSWRQDATNEEDGYTRNRIRHHILGYAKEELNRQAAAHICHAAGLLSQADTYLCRQARHWLAEQGHEEKSGDGGKKIRLDVNTLRQEEEFFRTFFIREACRSLESLTDLSQRHVAAVQALMEDRPGAGACRQVRLARGLEVSRSYGMLCFERAAGQGEKREAGEKQKRAAEECLKEYPVDESRLTVGAEPVRICFGGEWFEMRAKIRDKTKKIPTNRYTKWINYDRLKGPLVLRTRRLGDYILLPDGRKKTVKSYMIDEKIPSVRRDEVALLAQGSHVLWIVGYRLSAGARLSEDTKTVLQIKRYGGKKDGEDSCIDPRGGCGQEDQ